MSDDRPETTWHARFAWTPDGQAHLPSLAASWDRLATAVAGAETQQSDIWQQRFRGILEGQRFLPSKQLLHAAGVHPHATLASCLAIAPMADSLHGVFDALHDSVVCLHAGADVGVDFSNVLPSQWEGFGAAGAQIGPGPFANLWSVAKGLLGQGNGHAATVAMSLRCDHPDIENFVEALPARTLDPQIQAVVLVSDAFMRAVETDADWPLLFPLQGRAVPADAEVCERIWPGRPDPQPCLVHQRIKAQALWVRLLQAQRSFASPRLLFVDAMQRGNGLGRAEQIYTANPGASVPLSVDAACTTGHINLTRFVRHARAGHAEVDWDDLRAVTAIAVRFLDNALDISSWPHKRFARKAHATRRLGLGITGLASMLGLLGLPYGSASSLELTAKIMRTLRDTACQMSMELAREKGAFPAFDATQYMAAGMLQDVPSALQAGIARHGLRNSQLLAVGSDVVLDQLAQHISHGIEPLAGPASQIVTPEKQLELAARVQACVDNAVSVTIHVPRTTPSIAFDAVLRRAWSLQLKNCLVQRQL